MSSATDLSAQLTQAEAVIAAQREQIAQLQAQASLYQRVLDTLPLTVMWKDRSSVYLGCNAGFVQMAGAQAPADLIGKDDTMMPWAGAQADAFRADDREVMQSDCPKLGIVEPITDASGADMWLETNKLPLHDASGAVIGVVGTIQDITGRVQAEERRLAEQQAVIDALRASEEQGRQLQEQVIAAQQAALRELSTPLIPVTEDVVVMPLIGSIDSARAQQVIESLLQGVDQTRARTAILDITGVPVVDTQVANALLRAAQAVRLLGASVVLTGIRPEVAQTLVGLGADLSGIRTSGTLQAAIAQALGEQGRR